MTEQITISGDRYQVAANAWEGWVGNTTADEFMQGYQTIDDAVNVYIEDIPDMFGGTEPPTFWWTEMNAEYTLAELLSRYIEDNQVDD